MLYTYVWLREDGTPYYVGKGSGSRAYKTHKRHGCAPPLGRVVFYIAKDEAEAFENEIALIWYYGRKLLGTGCLRNMTDGGENPPKSRKGFHKTTPPWNKGMRGVMRHTEETITKMSATRKVKTPITAWIKGTEPWNKGKSPSEETRIKIGKAGIGRTAWNKGLKGSIPWNKGLKKIKVEEAHG